MAHPEQTCQHCGKKYTITYWIANPTKFCSHSCRNKARTRPIEERFWEKVKKASSCWLWIGAIRGGGYGVLGTKRGEKYANAHHFSWELHYGPVPEGLQVLHKCDVRHCVNPEHLFVGTAADNMLDKAKKGRNGRKLTRGDVLEIRSAIAKGNSNQILAADFGVTAQLINMIRKRKIWTEV
jgi:hypothetical protein